MSSTTKTVSNKIELSEADASMRLRVSLRSVDPDGVIKALNDGADPYQASSEDGKTAVDLAVDYGFCGFISAPGLASDFTGRCADALAMVFSVAPSTEQHEQNLSKALIHLNDLGKFHKARLEHVDLDHPEPNAVPYLEVRAAAMDNVIEIVSSSPAVKSLNKQAKPKF